MTVCHELCKNGETDQHVIWVVYSDGPNETCIRWGAQWRHLVNTIELSMNGNDMAFLSNYCFQINDM